MKLWKSDFKTSNVISINASHYEYLILSQDLMMALAQEQIVFLKNELEKYMPLDMIPSTQGVSRH